MSGLPFQSWRKIHNIHTFNLRAAVPEVSEQGRNKLARSKAYGDASLVAIY
jgi:hypothetical protein